MNTDDPKLTAFALGELDEPDRSTIAREIADSPEAQRLVDETREIARDLKSEFVAALETSHNHLATVPTSLIDIRDDPWFWSIARPLAIAVVITVFAILGAITIGKYKSRNDSNVIAGGNFTDIQAEAEPQPDAATDFTGPESVSNPLRPEIAQRIERVVIGELDPHLENGEIRVIETINDASRLQRLKKRLTTPVLSKKSHREFVRRTYELMFLDRNGEVVASAAFYQAPGFGFVLHPSKHAYQRDGHYFPDRGDAALPGDWESSVNYLGYVIPFPDWNECIGYSPGA
jgi:hypothetical protein